MEKIVYRKSKHKLPQQNIIYNKISDLSKSEDITYYKVSLVKVTKNIYTIFEEIGYEIKKQDGVTQKEMADYIAGNIASGRFIPGCYNYNLGNKFGKVGVKVVPISYEEYKHSFVLLDVTCFSCKKQALIKGNNQFQKRLGNIPGTKKKFYSCNETCKRDYKNSLRALGGNTTKAVRKRYHQAVDKNIYGYVYGIHDHVEDKWYIGKTLSVFARWEEHIMKTRVLSKIPLEHLSFRVLDIIYSTGNDDDDIMAIWNSELVNIERYNSIEGGYNIQKPSKYLKGSREYLEYSAQTIKEEEYSREEMVNIIMGGTSE